MKIALGQINPTIGDIAGNVALMRRAALRAMEQGAQVIVFPELSLVGYHPGDLLEEPEFQERTRQGLQSLLEVTRELPGLHWVVGMPTVNEGVGKPLHNSLVILKNGEELLSYAKQLLPTYGIFDERRHFEPGPDRAATLVINGVRLGLMVCEDAWADDASVRQDYAANPFEGLAQAGPDLVVSINASPSHIGKREQRHTVFGRACKRHALPIVWVNQVGGHDQLVFDGASFAMDSEGVVAFEATRFESDVATLTFNPATKTFTAADGEALPAVDPVGLPPMEFYFRQMVLGLRDYARRCGFKKAVVGSSGGIDSALTLAIAVEALGRENVAAITMPSAISSAGSVSDSQQLCENLGLSLDQVGIAGIVEAFNTAMMSGTLGTGTGGVAYENLQARVRGTLLMAYSNMYGHLLLTTGNKSELSVGYCTLYGDTNGGLGLLGDLYKTEVFELARHVNARAGRELIPLKIIDKEPSAELAPGQRDVDSLPPYAVLDEILKVMIEGHRLAGWERDAAQSKVTELEATSEGRAVIENIRGLINRNEYKRRQSPPIIRLRARAFGQGRQVPIAAVL